MATEMIIDQKRTWSSDSKRWEVWLVVDGTPVAWATLMDEEHYEGYMCLCDIETREGYRGKGFARTLMSLVVAEFGKPLATTGSFSPEGFASFYGKLPNLSNYIAYDHPTVKSGNFVYDWEKMYGPA